MLTSRWTHSGENWHEGQREGEKAGSPPPGPRTVPWIREGGRERMKGSFHGSLYLLDDYSFAFKPLRNTTSESGPSKSPPVRRSSRGKWKRFRCSFSLQASLTSALLPIPCYLELQSHWNFERESSITLSRAKQQEEMCLWGFQGVEVVVPENVLSLKVSVSFCCPNLIVILYSSEGKKKKNSKLQSVAGIIKQQIHHLLGEAETRGQS